MIRVTQVALRPTEASEAAGRPSLTPEALAASGARYSRNNEGLEAILNRIDPNNLDKSVDSIFRMIDYGHQSIADMAPVAMFIDGVSVWLAYYLWTLVPTAGGQESSTRYIQLGPEGLPDPQTLGIPEADQAEWLEEMQSAFDDYQQALSAWESLAEIRPELMGIPASLINDPSEKARKKELRLRRNFGFDRARYFLPNASQTNVMLVMSARAWVNCIQNLRSLMLQEAQTLGAQLAEELALAAPRLLKHAVPQASIQAGLLEEWQNWSAAAKESKDPTADGSCAESGAYLDWMPTAQTDPAAMASGLKFHDNRYAWMGSQLQRTLIRFGWQAMSFGEIRDLNRHRTGTKYCPMIPQGFYAALEQIPSDLPESLVEPMKQLRSLADRRAKRVSRAWEKLKSGEWDYIYWTYLGSQFPFEHNTTADKFIYEAELRTGTGAHYRYAEHLREVLQLWYALAPGTKGLVLEGSAEPE